MTKHELDKTVILLQCECKDFHFVQIYRDPEWDNSTWITHIERPRSLRQKLRSIWGILVNNHIHAGELMIASKDMDKLAKYFAKQAKPIKKPTSSKQP